MRAIISQGGVGEQSKLIILQIIIDFKQPRRLLGFPALTTKHSREKSDLSRYAHFRSIQNVCVRFLQRLTTLYYELLVCRSVSSDRYATRNPVSAIFVTLYGLLARSKWRQHV